MLKKLFTGTTIIAAAVLATEAQAFEFGKPITTPVVVTKPSAKKSLSFAQSKKEITLMNIKLNPREAHSLFSYTPSNSKSTINLPPTVNLGMNNVPVLDQGMHGTCVTFAITAAIDAVLGKGDYVSQLCNLELGEYLENKGSYLPSGWWGTFGPWALDQTLRFGIVSKANQKAKSCAEVTEYPKLSFTDQGKPMSLGEFKRMSEDINEKLYPVYRMNVFERFEGRFSDTNQADKVLTQVKQSLLNGNRVTFGTFIVLSPYCSAGACASYRATQDTWALTKELETPPFGTGGHEMVIFGYDDKAVALDQEGKRHQGLLMLRNSWGEEVGDQGNYYMTYDFFKKFVIEVQEIVEIKQG